MSQDDVKKKLSFVVLPQKSKLKLIIEFLETKIRILFLSKNAMP